MCRPAVPDEFSAFIVSLASFHGIRKLEPSVAATNPDFVAVKSAPKRNRSPIFP